MKQNVIAMSVHSGKIRTPEGVFQIQLPKGCIGILFCFESKKAAREYWGKDVVLTEIEEIRPSKSPEEK